MQKLGEPRQCDECPPEPALSRAGRGAAATSAAPVAAADQAQPAASLCAAVLGYTLWRFAETARTALFVFVGAIALALLAEALH